MTSVPNVPLAERRAIIKEYRERVLARLQAREDYYITVGVSPGWRGTITEAMREVKKVPLVPR